MNNAQHPGTQHVRFRFLVVGAIASTLWGFSLASQAQALHPAVGAGLGAAAGAMIGEHVGAAQGAVLGAGVGGLVGARIMQPPRSHIPVPQPAPGTVYYTQAASILHTQVPRARYYPATIVVPIAQPAKGGHHHRHHHHRPWREHHIHSQTIPWWGG